MKRSTRPTSTAFRVNFSRLGLPTLMKFFKKHNRGIDLISSQYFFMLNYVVALGSNFKTTMVNKKINDEGRKFFVRYSFFSTTKEFSIPDFISKLKTFFSKLSQPLVVLLRPLIKKMCNFWVMWSRTPVLAKELYNG